MVRNETYRRAQKQRKQTNYIDARADLERAVTWARELGYTGKLGIVGSSYSSSLAIFVGADSKDVSAVVSFSPGDYLPPRGSITAAGKRLDKPTLIVCPPEEKRQAQPVFASVASEKKQLIVQPEGVHGASTLDRSPTREALWKQLLAFLSENL
jgi:dienelactone hydrolase